MREVLAVIGFAFVSAALGRAAFVIYSSNGRVGRIAAGAYAVIGLASLASAVAIALRLNPINTSLVIVAMVAPVAGVLAWTLRPRPWWKLWR